MIKSILFLTSNYIIYFTVSEVKYFLVQGRSNSLEKLPKIYNS